MTSLKKHLSAKADAAASQAASLFAFANADARDAEKTARSNYSYWGSTFRVFLKNKAALTFLILLVLLLGFTFVQPFLPGQYNALAINNHPATGMQLSNLSPSLTGVFATAPAGTALIGAAVKDNPDWLSVTNRIATVKKRTAFTVLEYGESWCRVEANGQTGYVKNDFSTKLKLPDDPQNTPYEAKSNFPVDLYSEPADYSNGGLPLYARTESLAAAEGEMYVTASETPLYTLPNGAGFWFGTNGIGQDLWARVWAGTRTSLFIGFSVALTEALLGILMGVLWGYVRGLDRVLTEVYNVVDNIPTTIVLILISYILRPGVGTLIFAMCLTGWLGMARFIRNQIVIIRDRDYNLASRCLGTSTARIILRNLLPYLVSVIMMRMALSIPGAIGSEVFITYIGLGLPVDTPSLGNLINEGRKLITVPSLRYQLVFPAIVLSLVTISFYIIGNAFADAADPRNHV